MRHSRAAGGVKQVAAVQAEKHPKGLYILFATEMWERFSFYTMLSMLVLYLRDGHEGFGWTEPEAIRVYSWYQMAVYASPLIGGWIADRVLGASRSVMLGAVFFIAGHILMAFPSEMILYAALACLVTGNGFFKPNISTLVGSQYPPGSSLRDAGYNIFYMGINVGAFFAPIVAEIVMQRFGFHLAFAVAAAGMCISLLVFRKWKKDLAGADGPAGLEEQTNLAVDPDSEVKDPMAGVPDRTRILALVTVFAVVIVYWMVFHQNGSTLTYWADDNTDWQSWGLQVSGVVSNSINPFFIITLSLPLVAFWRRLAKRGKEPSTPVKIFIGMLLTGLSCLVLYAAALAGGDTGMVSPLWLIGSYAVISLGELCLSPMGLSLVSKVAPPRMKSMMMGGWFVATAIGNKLTAIGVYWTVWSHSTFFMVLALMALATAMVLFVLLRPLKKAMPGV
ncbi:MAG: peptide MFS transporter [Acidobacteria bacterium]|nr:peptide MFS transporter [Acidobacteriota bacterium]